MTFESPEQFSDPRWSVALHVLSTNLCGCELAARSCPSFDPKHKHCLSQVSKFTFDPNSFRPLHQHTETKKMDCEHTKRQSSFLQRFARESEGVLGNQGWRTRVTICNIDQGQ